jgi:hypothetical protein
MIASFRSCLQLEIPTLGWTHLPITITQSKRYLLGFRGPYPEAAHLPLQLRSEVEAFQGEICQIWHIN